VIRLDSVSKRHARQILLLDASMGVFKGEKVGLVGLNGAGKSTIFRMLVKEEEPDGGNVVVDRGVTIGYFSQDVGDMRGQSVLDATLGGAGEVSEIGHELHELEHVMADPARADELETSIERFGVVQARFDELGGYALESRAREILAGLGFAERVVEDDVGKLSGGWKMRVALARILLMRPDVLLLDEPTNHVDIATKEMLLDALSAFEGTMLFVSHDRQFLASLSNRVLELTPDGPVAYGGGYAEYVSGSRHEAPGLG